MKSVTHQRRTTSGLFPDSPALRLYEGIVDVLPVQHYSPTEVSGSRHWTLDARRFLDIRTVQELLGHKGVETTMIYTHVLNRGGRSVRSPAAGLAHRPDER